MVGELAAAKTGVDAAIFAGKVPAFKDEAASGSGTSANPAKENIGLTTKDAEFQSTDTRSNLLSEVKLIGDFATATLTGGSGAIVGTLGNNANIDIKGVEIGHIRAADGTWTCSVFAPATAKGWKDKYIPNGCTKSSAAITAPAAKKP